MCATHISETRFRARYAVGLLERSLRWLARGLGLLGIKMGRDIILCVDDEELALTMRKAVLETAGYEVLTIKSPKKALDVLATRAIDLVITDQLMKGMTGTELAAEIKRRSPQVKVLILSGLDEIEGATDNADAFLSKIERPPVLLALVKKLLSCDIAG